MSEEPESGGFFTQHGKASQFPQYDDITFRNMEVINCNAALRKDLMGGCNDLSLYNDLMTSLFYFGGLYDATFLEVQDKLSDDEITKINKFLNTRIAIPNNSATIKITTPLREHAQLALDVFIIYQTAMKHAGYRKTTYYTVNPEFAHRRNF